ncbi:putative Cytochrome c assembly protein DsbD [Vibrio nigripulchritudo SOn1]|uniref:Cytochrome c assembly protein DsbD n=2 Tax=Vibrio nigripulchritudo TaxID=28173 RepID=A0AAV2VP58_9VIBR|nr:sulfite exporter TauE/SafE family protein [Vibrio nigripulchritudo]CCO46248.1 putative Cytochrome c assembly protein DsbD [Vibrio nigripulchritudo SOn1]
MADWLGALIIGILGAGHCMGMCGGIASAVAVGNPNSTRTLFITLFYNLGRLSSYAVTGAVIGGAVSSIAQFSDFNLALTYLRLVSAVFMVLLGLYIAKWWQGLLVVEKLGQGIWKFVSPAGQKLLPLRSPLHALPFGFVWGWLPCGLVYSTLTWAAVSGSALDGAVIMFSFGLGTLPAMLLVGMSAVKFQKWQRNETFRQCGAIILIAYGLYTGYDAFTLLS